MIAVVLQGTTPETDRLLREVVAGHEGIAIVAEGGPRLFERADVDALVMDPWMAGEYFASRGPTTPAEVVVDEASGKRAFILEAVVSSARAPRRQADILAPWVVASASFRAVVPEREAPTGISASPAVNRPGLSDEEMVYATVLNALEVMERHNASSAQPKIRRAGLQVGAPWLGGLLRAYRAYRSRAQAGQYELDGQDGGGA